MFDLKAFVKSIRKKHSTLATVLEGPSTKGEMIAKILKIAKEELAKKYNGTLPEEIALRASLSELLLPQCIEAAEDGSPRTNKKQIRACVYGMAHHIGLLAALAIPDDEINKAIDQVANEAKEVAKQSHMILAALNGGQLLPKPPARKKEEPKGAVITEKKKMIEDLRQQAILEPDAAAKAALETMAWRIEKELSLSEV